MKADRQELLSENCTSLDDFFFFLQNAICERYPIRNTQFLDTIAVLRFSTIQSFPPLHLTTMLLVAVVSTIILVVTLKGQRDARPRGHAAELVGRVAGGCGCRWRGA